MAPVNEQKITIPTRCPRCATARGIDVRQSDWDSYKAGAYIQDAFRDLSANDREALMTGYCSSCWDIIFDDEGEG